MRNPHRIDPFLRAFGDVWKQHPDMRFGQLVMNLSSVEGGFADTWEWEDSDWYGRMQKYVDAREEGADTRYDCGGICTEWCKYEACVQRPHS